MSGRLGESLDRGRSTGVSDCSQRLDVNARVDCELNGLLIFRADHRRMTIVAALESRDTGANRRAHARRPLRLEVPGRTTTRTTTHTTKALIHDLSPTGMLIETSADLSVDDVIALDIPEAGASPAKIVWSSGEFFGCQFTTRISTAAISAALLQTPFEAPSPPVDHAAAIAPAAKENADAIPSAAEGLSLAARAGLIVGTSLLLWVLIAALMSLL